MNPLYQYKGQVVEIYDGDTITDITIDLGFGIKMTEEDVRLYGIDTYEMRDSINNKRTPEEKEKAVLARDLFRQVALGKDVIFKTFKSSKVSSKDKKGKYGRWLARVYVDYTDVMIAVGIDFKLKLEQDVYSGEISKITVDGTDYICINDLFLSFGLAVEEKY